VPPPASPATPAVVVRRERYDAPDARWAVERAEDELVARYGMLDDGELGLAAAMFEPPAGAFLVARGDGASDPVGCAAVRVLEPGTGEVRRVWVDPDWRRRGVARSLMDGLEAAARDLGLSTLQLATGDRQPEAIALYDATGWARAGVATYEGEAETVCVYRFVKTIG
jgi:N-acetylglutamate synthase-like GNAT family acetyltransferase